MVVERTFLEVLLVRWFLRMERWVEAVAILFFLVNDFTPMITMHCLRVSLLRLLTFDYCRRDDCMETWSLGSV